MLFVILKKSVHAMKAAICGLPYRLDRFFQNDKEHGALTQSILAITEDSIRCRHLPTVNRPLKFCFPLQTLYFCPNFSKRRTTENSKQRFLAVTLFKSNRYKFSFFFSIRTISGKPVAKRRFFPCMPKNNRIGVRTSAGWGFLIHHSPLIIHH